MLALVVFFESAGLWAFSAHARNIPRENAELQSDSVIEWLKGIELAVRIRTNPLQRLIVCRVAFADVSVKSMGLAINLSKRHIVYAATKLQEWGLVKLLHGGEGGYPTIVPANEKSRKLMRVWADQWCAQGDECGVQR